MGAYTKQGPDSQTSGVELSRGGSLGRQLSKTRSLGNGQKPHVIWNRFVTDQRAKGLDCFFFSSLNISFCLSRAFWHRRRTRQLKKKKKKPSQMYRWFVWDDYNIFHVAAEPFRVNWKVTAAEPPHCTAKPGRSGPAPCPGLHKAAALLPTPAANAGLPPAQHSARLHRETFQGQEQS